MSDQYKFEMSINIYLDQESVSQILRHHYVKQQELKKQDLIPFSNPFQDAQSFRTHLSIQILNHGVMESLDEEILKKDYSLKIPKVVSDSIVKASQDILGYLRNENAEQFRAYMALSPEKRRLKDFHTWRTSRCYEMPSQI